MLGFFNFKNKKKKKGSPKNDLEDKSNIELL